MTAIRSFLVTLTILIIAAAAVAQEGIVHYDMDVSLDPVTHRLEGSQRIRWTNRGGVATSELWWHLYLNAFANNRTSFMRELGSQRFRWRRAGHGGWGWIRFTRLTLTDGTDLLSPLEFVRPDDDNPDDFTVARVALPREVPPGAAVELEVAFEAQLPPVVARTGYTGDFHLVGQWFPKLGVFEGEDGWNCHQFHAAGEFFADYGSYRVQITVPRGWVIGATGLEVERQVTDRQQRTIFAADRVHDFAWCTAPASLMTVVEGDFDPGRDVPLQWLDRVRRLLGRSAADLELPPAQLRVLVPTTQPGLADRTLRAARLAIAWFGLHYGPYPYPQLTVVSPPTAAVEAGGMEYPTFITTGTGLLGTLPILSHRRRIEMVTVHEFGHQYFYGLLGSNEFEQAWLDEGLTSYAEIECMEAIVADRLAPGIQLLSPWFMAQRAWARYQLPLTVDQMAWQFRNLRAYYLASYDKTAIALKTLEGLVGEDRFARAMRTYVDRYRFSHPASSDLLAVFEEETGEELDWFFAQAFGDDAEVDWSVLSVRQRAMREPDGVRWDGSRWQEWRAQDGGADSWEIVVEVGRRGDFVGPLEVLLRYTDGTEERRQWDGRDRWSRWRFQSDERLVQVVADPDGVWSMETNRVDNYWRAEPRPRKVRRYLWWLPDAFQILGILPILWS